MTMTRVFIQVAEHGEATPQPELALDLDVKLPVGVADASAMAMRAAETMILAAHHQAEDHSFGALGGSGVGTDPGLTVREADATNPGKSVIKAGKP